MKQLADWIETYWLSVFIILCLWSGITFFEIIGLIAVWFTVIVMIIMIIMMGAMLFAPLHTIKVTKSTKYDSVAWWKRYLGLTMTLFMYVLVYNAGYHKTAYFAGFIYIVFMFTSLELRQKFKYIFDL